MQFSFKTRFGNNLQKDHRPRKKVFVEAFGCKLISVGVKVEGVIMICRQN